MYPEFSKLIPSDHKIYFESADDNDPRLGNVLKLNWEFYDQAKVVVLGCMQDKGVERNQGRVGAEKAPYWIRKMLYRMTYPSEMNKGTIFDMGNLPYLHSLEETHQELEKIVEKVIQDKKKLILLGGGNDITYPAARGLAAVKPKFSAFNINAHLDMRISEQRHSGTPYRQLMDEKCIMPDRCFHIGIQRHVNSPKYIQDSQNLKNKIYFIEDVQSVSANLFIYNLLKTVRSRNIFIGLDMDSIRLSYAPGVSAPSPIGLTANEVCTFATLLGRDKRSRVFQLCEVNPKYDRDNQTSRLAALLCYSFLTNIQYS